jgi:methylmalonyl-CoA/ethylmalonyl-CoA epimerase
MLGSADGDLALKLVDLDRATFISLVIARLHRAIQYPSYAQSILWLLDSRFRGNDNSGFGKRGQIRRRQECSMIGRLNHVAIAVPDLEAAAKVYRDTLGAKVSAAVDQPEHGVTTVFIELPNTKVELLGALGDKSPITAFLARNPNGGIHHLCYEVPDIVAARDRLVADGARVLGQGDPKIGAHGKPVLFLHPKDFCGTLVELEQA